MFKIFKLGYANFTTKDVSSMLHYYENVMGYTLVETGEKGEKYLSNGLDHHNIVLTPADHSSLRVLGYQMSNQLSLQEAKRHLEDKGIEVEYKSDVQPGVKELLEFRDPGGYIIQVYSHMEETAPGFKQTGIVPLKLGHIALGYKNHAKAVDFYMNVLQFDYTDKIGDRATFFTCNTDHHTLNCANTGYDFIHHIAFELKDASHQYASSDVLAKHRIPIFWGPSRHTAGHNIATYHHDPDDNVIELFMDMDQYIPELGYFEPRPWHETLPLKPQVWEGNNAWGTEFAMTITEGVFKRLHQHEEDKQQRG